MKKILYILILLCFSITSIIGPNPVYAQEIRLPMPGVRVHLSPEFSPLIIKGIKVHPDDPLRFEFILDRGDSKLSDKDLKDGSSQLIKYFLTSLTIPQKDLWVNLSPYEKDRIIPNSFGVTTMGRDLLAEDYILKQITASLIYPEEEIGKKFWKRVYEESARKYGTTNVPVNTFNKVWIVPEKALVYENTKAGTAYVVESKLKVMLEGDYLSLEKHAGIQSAQATAKGMNQLGSQIVREIVIPELTREVNTGKNFAQLRQVFNSLILANWYKKKIKNSILAQVYEDKNKVNGINMADPKEKQKIYDRYLQAFKKGAYNYIKEEQDMVTQQIIPRKYFSGGIRADFAMIGYITRFLSKYFPKNPIVEEVNMMPFRSDQNMVRHRSSETIIPFAEKEYLGIDFNPYDNDGTLMATGHDEREHKARSLNDESNGSNYIRHFESGPYQGKVFRISRHPRLPDAAVKQVLKGFAIAEELGIGPKVDGFTNLIDGRFTVVVDFEEGPTFSRISKEEFGEKLEKRQQEWSPYQKALAEFMDILTNEEVFVNDITKEGNMIFKNTQDGKVKVVLIDPEDAKWSEKSKGRDLIVKYQDLVRTHWKGAAKDFLLNIYFPQRLASHAMISKGLPMQRFKRSTRSVNGHRSNPRSSTGGIDLSIDKGRSVQDNGQEIKFHIDPAMLKQLQGTTGFTPLITKIQPMTDLKMFLGLTDNTSG